MARPYVRGHMCCYLFYYHNHATIGELLCYAGSRLVPNRTRSNTNDLLSPRPRGHRILLVEGADLFLFFERACLEQQRETLASREAALGSIHHMLSGIVNESSIAVTTDSRR